MLTVEQNAKQHQGNYCVSLEQTIHWVHRLRTTYLAPKKINQRDEKKQPYTKTYQKDKRMLFGIPKVT